MLGPNKIMSLFGHVITKIENGRCLETPGSYNLNVFLLILGHITTFEGVYDQYGYLPPLPQGFSRNLFFYSKFYPKGLIRPIRGYHILPKPIPIDLVDPKPYYSITKT